MRLIGVNVLETGDSGRVQVTLGDDGGNQLTYLYTGKVDTTINASSSGGITLWLSVLSSKAGTIAANSSNHKFDS